MDERDVDKEKYEIALQTHFSVSDKKVKGK